MRAYGPVIPLLKKTAADSAAWTAAGGLAVQADKTIAFLNAHAVNQACDNPVFAEILLRSDYLLRDGIGVKLALRWLGLAETENLNGTDLIPKIIASAKDRRIAIFGTSDTALAALALRLQKEGFGRLGPLLNGFLATEDYLAAAAKENPDIVILCLGMPQQELLADALRKNGFQELIVCGGGWADFYSGTKARAPEWMRALSIEWLHRLLSEPRRLGKRYTVDLFTFFLTVHRAAKIRTS